MNRRVFFGSIGKMLIVGAVTVVSPELMEETPQEKLDRESREWEKAFFEAMKSKPHFALAS